MFMNERFKLCPSGTITKNSTVRPGKLRMDCMEICFAINRSIWRLISRGYTEIRFVGNKLERVFIAAETRFPHIDKYSLTGKIF